MKNIIPWILLEMKQAKKDKENTNSFEPKSVKVDS